MSLELEKLILTSALSNIDYSSKIIQHFKSEFFSSSDSATIAKIFQKYFNEYKSLPTKDSLKVELEELKGISEETYRSSKVLIDQILDEKRVETVKKLDIEYILNKTEKYFKQQACQIAVLESVSIMEGESKKVPLESIPDLLKEAVSISFDVNIGHDYITNSEERFESYHSQIETVEFHLKAMNSVTNGGAKLKSLVVPIAPTGVGKSFFMTSWAADLITKGHDVLYITLEMAETIIAERIDANLFNVKFDELKVMPKSTFMANISKLKSENRLGSLKIKEYAPGTFSSQDLRVLLNKLKQIGFKPKVIMLDYINLAKSYRHQDISASGPYFKAVAEEMRGVAMDYNAVLCSPTQTNRDGLDGADFSLKAISESIGVAYTADFSFAMIETDDMRAKQQMRLKLLKNRWGSLDRPNSFMIKIDKSKMQMGDYDIVSQNSHQESEKKQYTNQPKNDIMQTQSDDESSEDLSVLLNF